MKKILTLIVPALLAGNLSIFTLQKNNKNVEQITWNLNINETKTFPKNTDVRNQYVDGQILNFNFLGYANSINEFVTKYPHFTVNSGNYLHVIMYKNDKTDHLNQVYNTNKLLMPYGYIADTLLAEYKFAGGAFYACVQLVVELAIVNNQLSFAVTYNISSPIDTPVAPMYGVSINSLTFLTS